MNDDNFRDDLDKIKKQPKDPYVSFSELITAFYMRLNVLTDFIKETNDDQNEILQRLASLETDNDNTKKTLETEQPKINKAIKHYTRLYTALAIYTAIIASVSSYIISSYHTLFNEVTIISDHLILHLGKLLK